jgi:hypothetical protein
MYNYSYFSPSLNHRVIYESLSFDQLNNRLIWDKNKNYTDVIIKSL